MTDCCKGVEISDPSACQLVEIERERERERPVPFEAEAVFDFEQLVGSFRSIDKVKTFPQSSAWLLRVTHPMKWRLPLS